MIFVRGVCRIAGRSQHTHISEGVDDALREFVALPVDAPGVGLEQYRHRVAGTASHLRRGHTGVEPESQGGMAQVVRPHRQR